MTKPAAGTKKSILDAKVARIEEKSAKPPGTARFHRTREEPQKDNLPFFQNDTFNVGIICQQLLVAGYVQSYVDFYQLTHRIDPSAVEESAMKQIQISEEDTKFIRDNLVKAEMSRRQGDTANVYAAFNKLADYYVRNQDWKTSFFFHEKCLEVAQLTNDVRAEMSANHSLGKIYQLMNDYPRACAYHERHEEIAASLDVFEEVAKANVELYKVYTVLADREQNDGNFEEALALYNQCLESAKKSWDKGSEAEANGKIGNLLLSHGEAQRSIPYLRQQSQISADLGNAEGRCRACTALAIALDKLNQSEKALTELNLVVSISEEVGDIYLQARASRSLGTLFSKLGRLGDAVEIFQKHFQLTKKLLSKPSAPISTSSNSSMDSQHSLTSHDLDIARAYVGIARGNLLLGSYTVALQSNILALLDWKLNRTEIKSVEITEVTQSGVNAAVEMSTVDKGEHGMSSESSSH